MRRSTLVVCSLGLVVALAGSCLCSGVPTGLRVATQIYGWNVEWSRQGKNPDEQLPQTLAEARKAGFGAIEGWLNAFATDEQALRFRELLWRNGLVLASVYHGGNLHQADAAEKTIATVLEWAERAKDFPGLVVNFNCAEDENKSEEVLRLQAENVNRLGKELQSRGMRLVLHNHTPEMANGAREFRAMVSLTDPKLVGFCLDLHWAKKAGQDPFELIRVAAGRIESVHLRNGNDGIWTEWLGEGNDIDYRAAARALKQAGFNGLLILELAYEDKTPRTKTLLENEVRSREYIEEILFPESSLPRDSFGGWAKIRRAPSGFFFPQEISGRWWLIDPIGNVFLSKGINHVTFKGDIAPKLGYSPYGRAAEGKYATAEKWVEATVKRLREWGFNTIGAWSSRETFSRSIPYTVNLDLAGSAGADWVKGSFPDVFSRRFEELVLARARTACSQRSSDPFLIGYFTDNELRWGADWRSRETLMEGFLSLPADAPGKGALIDFLLERYGSAEKVSEAWQVSAKDRAALLELRQAFEKTVAFQADAKDFLRVVAERYFSVCNRAIRLADPNHLNLGCRFAGYAPEEVLEGYAAHVDVISFNNYGSVPPKEVIERIHRMTGRPVMLTEFSFKAMDSGLPNTRGASQPVATQRDRADGFQRYVEALADIPVVLGYHWFQYTDQPASGRFDGENSNYGIVNGEDDPWRVLVKRMTEVNEAIESRHAGPTGNEGP
ncbi:MAG: TIM barrel protein [bacterium]|nr:TIM barrel protein [bacterium]